MCYYLREMLSVQFTSVTQLCLTFCHTIDCSTTGFPVHHQLPELTQTHVHRVGDAFQPSHSLSLLLLPSIFPSIRVFSNESVLHIRWPKYWSFSFSISPCKEYSGLISFRIDWLDLLAVQGILKSLLQHHSSKASILQCSAIGMLKSNLLWDTAHPWRTLTLPQPSIFFSRHPQALSHTSLLSLLKCHCLSDTLRLQTIPSQLYFLSHGTIM